MESTKKLSIVHAMKITSGPLSLAIFVKLLWDVFTPGMFNGPGGFVLGFIATILLCAGIATSLSALNSSKR